MPSCRSLNVPRHKRKRVVVAMSGGVDSSVAAALLSDRGYEVIGVTMRLYDAPYENAGKLSKSCCGLEDVEDARAACRVIGARHYYMNFAREFEQHVIGYFISEYEQGRTPYPCLACNDRMKFDFLLRRANYLGADLMATGHYAQIVAGEDGSHVLKKGIDHAKDQSYALFNLSQGLLDHLLFPIGHYTKEETRSLAEQFGLPNADKPDSQDICFIPSGKYRDFVGRRAAKPSRGEVLDVGGKFLGNHDGVHNFTVGQRRGIPGSHISNRPIYVTSINAQTGTVVVGHAEDLMSRFVKVGAVNWVAGSPPLSSDDVTARIRYRAPEVQVRIMQDALGGTLVETSIPVRAVTPGQAIVFYRGESVLGGGIIEGSASPPPDIGDSGSNVAAPDLNHAVTAPDPEVVSV